MTPLQRDLARDALGLPNERNRSYRNRFYTPLGTPEYSAWMAMARDGHAKRGLRRGMLPRFFWLTLTGAMAAIEANERLDRQDFPDAPTKATRKKHRRKA